MDERVQRERNQRNLIVLMLGRLGDAFGHASMPYACRHVKHMIAVVAEAFSPHRSSTWKWCEYSSCKIGSEGWRMSRVTDTTKILSPRPIVSPAQEFLEEFLHSNT